MNGAALLFTVMLASQAPQEARSPEPMPLDLRAAADVAVAELLLEDVGIVVLHQDAAPAEVERGFWTVSKDGLTEPAELMFLAASVADIWSRAEVTRLCEENAELFTCSNTELSATVDS